MATDVENHGGKTATDCPSKGFNKDGRVDCAHHQVQPSKTWLVKPQIPVAW